MRTCLTVNIETNYFANLDVELKSKSFSFNSLSKNFDNFNHLINELKLEFDILSISESRVLMSVYRIMSLNKPQLNERRRDFAIY